MESFVIFYVFCFATVKRDRGYDFEWRTPAPVGFLKETPKKEAGVFVCFFFESTY